MPKLALAIAPGLMLTTCTLADTPQEFAAFIKQEHARWGPIIREAGIRAD